jgi:hypothetical protein
MMTLIGDYNSAGDSALYYVTAHEEAHMWLPMIVGVDEKRRAWMDEGSTSFHENQSAKEFFPGRDFDEGDRRSYIAQTRRGTEGEMMRWTDFHYQGASGVASYSKPDWFWHSWYYEIWTLDQAVEGVEDVPGGARITIADHGYLPMPAYVTVTYGDGTIEDREVPVGHWLTGQARATVTVTSDQPVVKVAIDAAGTLPDVDRDNNVWERD